MGFSLVLSYTLGFSPLWKSLGIFKTVSLVKCLSQFLTFTSVSFDVHLQVVSTKKRFYAYFTCRKPFSSKQWPCGPSNSSNIWKLLHNICICQHFLQKLGLYPVCAFMCIFKLFPLENVLAHNSHAEGLFFSMKWPCGPSNSSDIRQLLHNICICQHFLQK